MIIWNLELIMGKGFVLPDLVIQITLTLFRSLRNIKHWHSDCFCCSWANLLHDYGLNCLHMLLRSFEVCQVLSAKHQIDLLVTLTS